MDFQKALDVIELTDSLILDAEAYKNARLAAGEAKKELEILLASKYLSDFRKEKKNLGYEMALLLLLEHEPSARETYEQFIREESKYKGLEKIIEAKQTKISFLQSLLKYQIRGEKGEVI